MFAGGKNVAVWAKVKTSTTIPLLRGTIVNRTYGIDENLYIHLFLLTIFGPIYYDGQP